MLLSFVGFSADQKDLVFSDVEKNELFRTTGQQHVSFLS
jgi:hypothetical protein